MAYVSVLNDLELDIQVLTENNGLTATVQIGYDDETNDVFSVVAFLAIVPGKPNNHMELIFSVTRAEVSGSDEPTSYNDGIQTRSFLRGEDRKRVLRAIAACAKRVIQRAHPDAISMQTAVASLPDVALTKYAILCDDISSLGYEWGRGDSYHGTHIWMLRRR